MTTVFWLRIGAIWAFLAVSMGAFGAHGLKDRFETLGKLPGGMTTDRLQSIFETGAQYHMYAAFAILVVGILAGQGRWSTVLNASGWLFLVGSVIFSGSLYLLSVTGVRILGAITPIGGVLTLAGWIALAVAAGRLAHD
jgi:uncharacterized membrane protein YgdD (TMEM256/DUF423 family)